MVIVIILVIVIFSIYQTVNFIKINMRSDNQVNSKTLTSNMTIKELANEETSIKKEYSSPYNQDLSNIQFDSEHRKRIINDSFKLINTTHEPKVFFDRYALLLDNISDVLKVSRNNKLNDVDIQKLYSDISNNESHYIDKLIQRMIERLNEKVQSLTTDKAKINNINKFKQKILEYSQKFSDNQIEIIENIEFSVDNNLILQKQLSLKKVYFNNDVQQSQNKSSSFDIYNDWNISISFGKSTSKNFNKAIYLAKSSNKFIEDTDESGNTIYQSFYTKDNFLEFQRLYKLIGNWKSSFVFINGEIIDTKSFSKINICYGDKQKFNDPDFCFGASEWTSNPFGCHRLMLTPSQTPWWEFGEFDLLGDWIINKKAIKEKIEYKSKLFQKCPSFNKNLALNALESLPNKIKRHSNNQKWHFTENGVQPIETYSPKIDLEALNPWLRDNGLEDIAERHEKNKIQQDKQIKAYKKFKNIEKTSKNNELDESNKLLEQLISKNEDLEFYAPAYERLSKNYRKQKRYKDEIDICNLFLMHVQPKYEGDAWIKTFEKRILFCRKKLN